MTLQEYRALISQFLGNEISVGEFEERYLAAFKAEPGGMDEALFKILDRLFADVDAYSPDCLPGQESVFVISESELRKQASTALDRLDKFLRAPRPS